ncbi:hypothetical protein [Pseudomonas sp. WAC2]|uniref:hypothetical protein n=1 Tax=Pseudomonas sp. WAC2 TaxID=3055057 RepID=UPI0025B047A1|nr:hypothetical protein [Pseudomonas sp. WAC2]MDN3235566.1 hypothetical protein [Pseudomonas sp. WAC2]
MFTLYAVSAHQLVQLCTNHVAILLRLKRLDLGVCPGPKARLALFLSLKILPASA